MSLLSGLLLLALLAIPTDNGADELRTFDVEVRSDDPGVMLAGTVTLPTGKGPFPGAVLLTVAGPNDRDQTVLFHKGFRVLAEGLAKRGIATLRLDDRGVGASTGVLWQATYDDLAGDALAAHALLSSVAEIRRDRVGFIGNSEGGAIGPLAASRSDSVAFVVLLAGPGLAGHETLRQQLEAAIRVGGTDSAAADSYRDRYRTFLEIQARDPLDPRTKAQMREFLAGGGRALFPPYSFVPSDLDALTDYLLSRWHRSQIAYEPAPVLGRLEQPVLALWGDKDRVMFPELHLPPIRKALEDGHPQSRVQVLPGLNHLFQTAITGSPVEYAYLSEAVAPAAIEIVADWILGLTGPRLRR